MENKWTCVAGFTYGGEHFNIWAQPILNSDGTNEMATKSEKVSYEEMKKNLEEQGIKYHSA